MKILYLATLAAATVVVAKPRQHHEHRRAHEIAKRAGEPSRTVTAPAVTRTAVRYVLDGNIISEEEVRNGIANGTLMWGIVEAIVPPKQGPVALPTAKPTPSSSQQGQKMPQSKSNVPESSVRPHFEELTQPNEKPADGLPSQSAPKPPDTVPDDSPKTAQELVDANGNCESCNKAFPNGRLPCNQFPHGYGAMPVDQEGLGGWSGIQDPSYRGGDGFDDIVTVPSGSCKDGSCCKPGHWCSYGCPNPYLKLSFPKKQGRTGQTVGGLYCNPDGMLEMADGSLGKTLCGKDSQHMTVKVHNRLSKPVSICRTDYPGTESMTFPLTLKPGQIGYLANPDQSKYFFWQNKPTSAHYYINKQGVSEAQGCTWGDPNGDKGNWAPAIFGTSYDDIHSNEGYSSLKQNELNKNNLLDYSITFTGDGVVSPCSYKKKTDEYCRGKECWRNKDEGCTAAIKQGSTLTLVLHDDD